MRGGDRGLFHNKKIGPERIIDYFIALEYLFLIDGEKYFLRKTIAKRISKFLSDASLEKKIKKMYDARSKIVHGGYIEANNDGAIKENDREEFEQIIRKIFIKLFDYNFSAKNDTVQFMKGLFDIPEEALKIMRAAQDEATGIIAELES